MINREILYERNLTGSYMKIPVSSNPGFDEKIMLKRKLPGILPVEKCFVNGLGQYWYNISGKQSLDMYCRMKDVGIDFIERMIVSICNEIEILEWNLLDTRCLILDPELIFVTNQNKELIFTIYPGESAPVEGEFQQLMEYMLTRIDHKDDEAVKTAYSIYEQSLNEGYSLMDLKKTVFERKEKPSENVDKLIKKDKNVNKVPEKPPKRKFWTVILEILGLNVDKFSDNSEWIEPNTEYEEVVLEANPTICLSDYGNHPKGRLIYSGNDELTDIILGQESTKIGKGQGMDALIDRGTISNYHARIEERDREYYIEDINSTNGTRVNGEPLPYKEKKKLNANDLVSFADVEYRFV